MQRPPGVSSFITRKPAAIGLIIRQRLESEATVANPRNFQYPHNSEYDQYRAELQRYFAKRARDPNATDDLVQSVYERILKYTKDGSVRDTHAYIFKAAVNVLSDANKRAIEAFGSLIADHIEGWEARLKAAVPDAQILDLPGSGHYIFMTREAEVLRAVDTFSAAAGSSVQPPAVRRE